MISGFVDDSRQFRSLAFKQDWQYGASERWLLSAGFEIKRLEAEYRYEAVTEFSPPFDQILDNGEADSRSAGLSPRGSQYAAYAELRWRPADRLTLDAQRGPEPRVGPLEPQRRRFLAYRLASNAPACGDRRQQRRQPAGRVRRAPQQRSV